MISLRQRYRGIYTICSCFTRITNGARNLPTEKFLEDVDESIHEVSLVHVLSLSFENIFKVNNISSHFPFERDDRILTGTYIGKTCQQTTRSIIA